MLSNQQALELVHDLLEQGLDPDWEMDDERRQLMLETEELLFWPGCPEDEVHLTMQTGERIIIKIEVVVD